MKEEKRFRDKVANSYLYSILLFVVQKGSVYKSDLMLYANSLYSQRADASRALSELFEHEYIQSELFCIDLTKKKSYIENIKRKNKTNEDSIESGNEKTSSSADKKRVFVTKRTSGLSPQDVEVISVTSKGFKQLKAIDGRSYKSYEILANSYSRTNLGYDKKLRLFNDNHIKTMFSCCGVPTEEREKPNLAMLYCHIKNREYKRNNFYVKLDITSEQIDSLYNSGIFYSDSEVRYFAKNYLKIYEPISSVFRGVFISKDKCVVVYSNGKHDNLPVYIKYKENEIALRDFLSDCEFFVPREIANTKTGMYVLNICDGESYIYSEAVGSRSGQQKKDTTKMIKNRLTPKHDLFTNKDRELYYEDQRNMYKAFFAVAASSAGVNSLQYLVSNSIEEHLQNTYKFLGLNPVEKDKKNSFDYSAHKEKNKLIYPCRVAIKKDKFQRVIYMPIYELLTLIAIQEEADTEPPIIITTSNMHNTIQHITHKKHTFLDVDTMKKSDINATIEYDKLGYEKGKKMLQDYLRDMRKTVNTKQLNQLPILYSEDNNVTYSYNAFYNAIANDKIAVEDCLKYLELKEYVPRNKSSKVHKMNVYGDDHSLIKEYAKSKGISIVYAHHILLLMAKDAMENKENKNYK